MGCKTVEKLQAEVLKLQKRVNKLIEREADVEGIINDDMDCECDLDFQCTKHRIREALGIYG